MTHHSLAASAVFARLSLTARGLFYAKDRARTHGLILMSAPSERMCDTTHKGGAA